MDAWCLQKPVHYFFTAVFVLGFILMHFDVLRSPEAKKRVLGILPRVENQYGTHKQVIYADLSQCSPKPNYFPELKAHCWGECNSSHPCAMPASYSDVKDGRAKMICIANLHLVGVRKSATTDFSRWIKKRTDIDSYQRDYGAMAEMCPKEYFQTTFNQEITNGGNGFYNGGPGNLMTVGKVSETSNSIHLVTAMQYLGYMATENTKFYVQLRNPADRVVSYLFHWHKLRMVYKGVPHKRMDAAMVDLLIKGYLYKLQTCIKKHGELYCVHLSNGKDGDMHGLVAHSMYVVYIREAFKFVPRQQFMFKTTEEYSRDRLAVVNEVTEFFGLPHYEYEVGEKMENVGSKNPVWCSTLTLLDEFFAPYNKALAALLGGDKWLFEADRSSKCLSVET